METDDATIGTAADMAGRMAVVLPARWFPSLADAPLLRGLLTGIGEGWAFCYGLLAYAHAQARIGTATGAFLDMAASDFFGATLRRRSQEVDGAYRRRIAGNLLREQATRTGIAASIAASTNADVSVFEPFRPADTGGYGSASDARIGGGYGYGARGLAYGSLAIPFQFLLDIERPRAIGGIAGVAGYGAAGALTPAPGGYGVGEIAYGNLASEQAVGTDAEIESAVLEARPAGSIAWIRLR